MDKIIYSEKEIEIFNGIIQLIKDGANPYFIKVSDIAKASDVGKGTIYDYFTSKEEAISKAIMYNLNNEMEASLARIRSKKGFKDRFYEILKCVVDGIETNGNTINLLFSTGGLRKFYEYLVDDKYDLTRFIDIVNKEVDNLLELGFSEGIISSKESKYYQVMALQGAAIGFSHYIRGNAFCKEIDEKEAMDTAYRLLVKSLN